MLYELEKVAKQRFNNDNVKLDVKASYIGSKIFEADHLCKSFGDLKILDDFSYIFARYEKWVLWAIMVQESLLLSRY